jgi:peroxiredoxin
MKKSFILILLVIRFSANAQLEVGSAAPEIFLDGIYNLESGEIPTIETLKGQIVVLYFWATWCSPCIKEFPKIDELHERYQDQVQIIAITDDPKDRLENFLAKMSVNFLIGRDFNTKTINQYQITGRPTVYVLNREGTIVYQGSKFTVDMLDEAIATNSINIIKEEKHYKVISNGGFSGGEDPLYNAMNIMLGVEKDYRPSLIGHIIIRPSLEKSFGGHGTRMTKDGYIGFTYSGGELVRILMLMRNLTSNLWITDKTKDTTRYDIIYWKKAGDFKSAFTEIEHILTTGLSISIDIIETAKKVNVLSVSVENEFLKKHEEIDEGTFGFYTHINSFISQLEHKSREYYLADNSSQNTFIYNKGMEWDKFRNATSNEILDFLKERGVTTKVEDKTISLLEINHK